MTSAMDGVYRPPEFDRIRKHTPPGLNRKIDAGIRAEVAGVLSRGPEEVGTYLKDLDREWDVDRAVMMNFAVVGGLVFFLGKRVNPKWHRLFTVQLGFMAYHALSGWCPPVTVFRRLGFRTRKEIDAERMALMEGKGATPPETLASIH